MAVSQRPFDPYRADAKVYQAGEQPTPQTTLILRSGTSCFEGFRKLSLISTRVIMNRWHVVEYKGVYCLVFP
jgi:hypothetical protein